MAARHTPGPWRPVDFMVEASTAERIDTIAVTHGRAKGKLPYAECRANARFIAAAPELEDELLDALAWYMDQVYDGGRNPAWVAAAYDTLGDLLSRGGDLQARYAAVERELEERIAELRAARRSA